MSYIFLDVDLHVCLCIFLLATLLFYLTWIFSGSGINKSVWYYCFCDYFGVISKDTNNLDYILLSDTCVTFSAGFTFQHCRNDLEERLRKIPLQYWYHFDCVISGLSFLVSPANISMLLSLFSQNAVSFVSLPIPATWFLLFYHIFISYERYQTEFHNFLLVLTGNHSFKDLIACSLLLKCERWITKTKKSFCMNLWKVRIEIQYLCWPTG